MRLLYDFAIRLFVFGMNVAAFFHPKARLWVKGRQHWRARYRNDVQKSGNASQPCLWLHAASLGEFEQGRPLIETFREQHPDWRIVLTFFSPSGYEIRKNYTFADWVCYLPADTSRNAADFLDIIQPDAVVFVKYEFWGNYLFELKKRGIPTLLISALFRKKQPFFQWYGGFWRSMLGCFTHFFVQNQESADLLRNLGFQNATVAGDTRVDRVLSIAENVAENGEVGRFSPPQPPDAGGLGGALIIGSSWEADENILLPVLKTPDFQQIKVIIAPHEPSEANVQRLCVQLNNPLRYTQAAVNPMDDQESRWLIIDNVGLLNQLYRYGSIAYIGGGLGKGIHNTLEPAAFGLPIIFGPKYEKFEEARQFVARGGAFPVHSSEELAAVLKKLLDPVIYQTASEAVKGYLEESRGATKQVMAFLNIVLSPLHSISQRRKGANF